MKGLFALAALMFTLVLTGCAGNKKQAPDNAAFRESKPRSILVLPPQNDSPDVKGSYGFLSASTLPLAEAGYYVFPVAVVNETFKQNGMVNPGEISAVPLSKLREIFGADAVMYITVKQYGTSYQVVNSDTRVTATARLVDLRSGKQLWSGGATASSNDANNHSTGGVLAVLLSAAYTQIADTLNDKAFDIAKLAAADLFATGTQGTLLYGPRSPEYGKSVQ